MIATLHAEFPAHPLQQLCHLFALPRSSYYYAPTEQRGMRAGARDAVPATATAAAAAVAVAAEVEAGAVLAMTEAGIAAEMEKVLMRWPFYGYRRMRKELLRRGVVASERKVRRLLLQMQVSRNVGRWRPDYGERTPAHVSYPNRVRNLRIVQPNQVWWGDITYIRLGVEFFYLAVILDGYARSVRGWAVSAQVDHKLTLAALQQALQQGKPHFFHSDQGVQYAAAQHIALLKEHQIGISMSDKGSPTQNAVVERFMRTLKEEHVNYAEYEDLVDARQQLQHWLEVEYMTERIHSSLGYLTPAEYEAAAASIQPTLP